MRVPYLHDLVLLLGVVAMCCWRQAHGHVALTFPPPRSANDFLDTVRTSIPCGEEATGADHSLLWQRAEERHGDGTTAPRTVLYPGSDLNVTWSLRYPHVGGWSLELYREPEDEEGAKLATRRLVSSPLHSNAHSMTE